MVLGEGDVESRKYMRNRRRDSCEDEWDGDLWK